MTDHSPMLTDRDWSSVLDTYFTANPFAHAVLDGLFTPAGLDAMRDALVCHEEWEERGSNLRWNRPPAECIRRAGAELTRALKPLVLDMRIISYWVIAASSGAGIRMHADNSTVSLNVWIGSGDAATGDDTDGMRFYNVLRPEQMDYATFSSHEFCEAYVAERGGEVAVRVPYQTNRAVLFDARVMHSSERVAFPACDGLLGRRINLTYSWDDIALARARVNGSKEK